MPLPMPYLEAWKENHNVVMRVTRQYQRDISALLAIIERVKRLMLLRHSNLLIMRIKYNNQKLSWHLARFYSYEIITAHNMKIHYGREISNHAYREKPINVLVRYLFYTAAICKRNPCCPVSIMKRKYSERERREWFGRVGEYALRKNVENDIRNHSREAECEGSMK